MEKEHEHLELTLVEVFRLALIEDYACPECLGVLDRNRRCRNPRCLYDTGVEWPTGEDDG